MSVVWLALGTNLNDRAHMLKRARDTLAQRVEILRVSPIFETQAQYVTHQPAFLNQVMEIRTTLRPFDLLTFLKETEKNLGRQRRERYGPREIDLDILFFGDLILEDPLLTIPHPLIPERRFVLEPLKALAPNLICPRHKKSITQLLEDLDHG